MIDYLSSVVRPAAELHLALLVVEGEPGDVDLAGGLEDAGGDVGARTLAGQHHVRRVRAVKCLVSTKQGTEVKTIRVGAESLFFAQSVTYFSKFCLRDVVKNTHILRRLYVCVLS